jgi:hypothetical protein
MGRSRHVAHVSVAAALALVFATAGWCDGPFGLTGFGCGDGGFLTVGGGFGRGTTFHGGNSRVPGSDLGFLGLYNGFTNYGWMKLKPTHFGGVTLGLTWDYFYSMGHGSSYYDGPPHPIIGTGNTIDTQFFVMLNSVSLDVGMASLIGAGSRIKGGLRLQLAIYGDSIMISDADADQDITGSAGYSMFGFGFWGSLDLASLSGLDWVGRYAAVKPRLMGAAAAGGDGRMNYWEWEVFLRLLTAGSPVSPMGSVSFGPVDVEIGYANYTFVEHSAGTAADATTRLAIGIPLIRASVPISF